MTSVGSVTNGFFPQSVDFNTDPEEGHGKELESPKKVGIDLSPSKLRTPGDLHNDSFYQEVAEGKIPSNRRTRKFMASLVGKSVNSVLIGKGNSPKKNH